MDATKFVEQTNDVVELALDEIEVVAGGFPVIPPKTGG